MKRQIAPLLLGVGVLVISGLFQACGESPSQSLAPADSPSSDTSPAAPVDPTSNGIGTGGDRIERGLAFGRSTPELRHVAHPGLTLKVRGKFAGALDLDAGNLPAVNYPLPELYGGRFEGIITLAPNTVPNKSDVPTGGSNYDCAAVDLSVLSATGVLVHRITSGPNLLRRADSNTRITIDLNPDAYTPALPGELRLELDGYFKPRDGFPPTADEINQAALNLGFVEIGGPAVGSYWVLNVALVEIAAFEGVEGS